MSKNKGKSCGDVADTAKKHCLFHCTTILFRVLYYKTKSIFFTFCAWFFCVLFVWKVFKPITVQYYIADCVSLGIMLVYVSSG